jgi:2-dehydro-3-deoxygluconokinase
MIETDANGERRFFHWRDSAAARALMDLPQTNELLASIADDKVVYLSAITLSLYGEEGRARLFGALRAVREKGTRVSFDTNFRARGWPDLAAARRVYEEMFAIADIVLASTEDLLPLYPGADNADLLARIPSPETVLKLAEPACIVRAEGREQVVRAVPLAHPVVDTTAAGDSFAAAYLAARQTGASPVEAAHAGHRLAGVVVGHPGAIIPRAAMPADVLKR